MKRLELNLLKKTTQKCSTLTSSFETSKDIFLKVAKLHTEKKKWLDRDIQKITVSNLIFPFDNQIALISFKIEATTFLCTFYNDLT